VTYVPGSIKVSVNGAGFAVKTDSADNDGIKYDAGTKSVIAPDGATTLTIPSGQTWAVQFQATLNAGTSSGSAVVNQASIQFTSGGSTITEQTNGDTCLVSQLAGIDLTTTATPKTGDPGDQIIYPFTAVNNGNNPDTINFTTPPTSTQGWTWAIWADTNGDGIPDYLLTDTNGDGKKDTGVLPQNGTINLLAVATIPAGTANGTTDTVTISGFSVFDPTKTDTLSFTTTVRAPILSMVKELVFVKVPSGSGLTDCTPTNKQTGAGCENTYVPGSILTYQVTATNSGNGNATVVVLTDLIPTHTTYKTGTIRTGSSVGTLTARTDATDGDGAEFNTGANAIVVPDGGTLTIGPTGTSVFEFQVTIN
ncbi:MAG: hypothetical protein NTW65_11180, partial [Deltaproteobacteria bacterium]|nr:hypothetical protein [Deltaproteobacteria bacterium]